ncbi:hypothetical protein PT274_03490 [Leuconostocaceae bacterium ESL0958]|nr:hypothetical protein [Leuconostocaceae bacterium ESL0958]
MTYEEVYAGILKYQTYDLQEQPGKGTLKNERKQLQKFLENERKVRQEYELSDDVLELTELIDWLKNDQNEVTFIQIYEDICLAYDLD